MRRGDAIPVLTDNEKNLILIKKEYKDQEMLLLIYSNEKEDTILLEETYLDLFTGNEFDGRLEPYSVKCLLKKGKIS